MQNGTVEEQRMLANFRNGKGLYESLNSNKMDL